MKKGFTLIKLLVVLVILTIGKFAFDFVTYGGNRQRDAVSDFQINSLLWPRQAHAQAEQDQARELKRANDLKERELRLLESKK